MAKRIIFFLFVFFIFTTNSQTYTIGSISGSSSTAVPPIPINSNHAYTYSQTIYSSNLLSGQGMTPGMMITSISWYVNSANASNDNSLWSIYLGSISQPVFLSSNGWVSSSSLTQVYAGIVVPSPVGWKTVILTTPYVWDGSGLIIAVDENSPSYNNAPLVNFALNFGLGNKSICKISTTDINPLTPGTATGLLDYYPAIQIGVSCWGSPANASISLNPTVGCTGSQINITSTGASTGTGISYQWQSSPDTVTWTNVGTNSLTYSANPTNSLYYQMKTTCSYSGNSTFSNQVLYTANPIPSATVTASGPTNFCIGSTVNLTAESGPGYTYQWKNNGIFITGATSQTYSASSSGNYTVVVTNSSGCSATSIPVDVSVNGSVAGTVSSNQTICEGTTPANITLTGNTGTIQWQVSTDNIIFTNITGATSSPLTSAQMGTLTATCYYRAVVTSGACASVNSAVVTVTVSPTSVAGTVSANQSICTETSPANITLTGNTGTIQWQVSTDNLTFTNIPGATSSPLTSAQMGTLSATRYYRAVVTSGACASVNSAVVSVTVSPTSVAGTVSANQTICTGTTPANITITGNTGTIQWQESTDNITFTNITGATSSPLTSSQMGTLTTTRYYRAIVTSGVCASINSSVVTVSVNPIPVITSSNVGSSCSGFAVNFPLTSNVSGSTFLWVATDNAQISGESLSASPSSTITDVLFNNTSGPLTVLYTVTPSYTAGAMTCIGANQTVTITVSALPIASITASGPTTFCIGFSVTLTANYGTGLTYQWKNNGVNISGATSQTYNATSSGNFTVVVTNSNSCSTTSSATVVTVNSNTLALSSAVGTNNQTLCINSALTNITYSTSGATGAIVTGLPPGVTGTWATDLFTISGTPTEPGTFNYTVTMTGGCTGLYTATGNIIVNPNTITLSSAVGTNNQTLCINTALTNITYSTSGAIVTGLPPGVTGTWATDLFTISGTPTVSGTFNYTVTMTGGCTGGTNTATGTIIVNPNNTITLSSAVGTNNQTRCINTALTNITYSTTGATGATVTGLPTGVTGSWLANVFTISGTPTASGTFNYTVIMTGGCTGVTNAIVGLITVRENNSLILTSDSASQNQSICFNQEIENINFTVYSTLYMYNEVLECNYNGPKILINEFNIFPTNGDGSLFGDSPISSGRGEWIELYNPNWCDSVDISGYILGSYNSTSSSLPNTSFGMAFIIPNGTVVPPLGFAIIRGVNAPIPTSNVLDVVVNNSNNQACIQGGINSSRIWFQNSGSWFAIYNSQGVPQDAVKWGTPINGDLNQSPCIPLSNNLPNGTSSLPTFNQINALGLSAALGASAQGLTFQRIPDGTAWSSTLAPENSSYGTCNDLSNCNEYMGYLVSGLPSGVMDTFTSDIITISGTPEESGTFNFNISLFGGCSDSVYNWTGSITVNPLPPSDISALSTTIFCEGDSVVLQGNNIVDGIYSWSNQNGIISNSNASSFTAFETSIYSYVVSDTNNCSNQSDTIEIIVNTHNSSEIYTTSLGPFNLNGITYFESGVYTQNLQTVAGCDSMLTIHLQIENISMVEISDECTFLIYPNPSKENVVFFKKVDDCEVKIESIYDIYGRQIAFIQNENKVQLLTEEKGLYFLIYYVDKTNFHQNLFQLTIE